MIKVENLSFSFAQKDLYNKISFTLEYGVHCAFIGTSGSGKSTLTEMIMDREKYLFDGKLLIEENARINYVSQFSNVDSSNDLTVYQYIAEVFTKLEHKIAAICDEMATSDDLESLSDEYQKALDQFESIGGNEYETNITKQLNLVNLLRYENLPVNSLSGGEFKLVQVIKEMLVKPDLMIMDEPDVFLDFDMLAALRTLINSHKGTLLVITHNRYLLNHCFNKILHLENMELQEFDGNYADYNLSLLARKIELQELAAADNEELERNEILIEKLRDLATFSAESAKGRSLNARVKIHERLQARRIKSPFVEIKQPNITLSTDNVADDTTILSVEDYTVTFDDLLLEHVNFKINSKDKVVIIGANGCGKTTLLRDIFKNENDCIKVSEDTKIAYFSQIQGETINESNTILEEFFDSGFNSYDDIINHVAGYGFSEDIINQKISSLSGGEKNILQLAKVSSSNANLLLLDEPTSHLDTYSQMALDKALNEYNGAILMISHDFHSIVNCMDFVLIIDEKTIRKMTMRKFRKMIYAKHFSLNYLEISDKKKALELKINTALNNSDFETAKILFNELQEI